VARGRRRGAPRPRRGGGDGAQVQQINLLSRWRSWQRHHSLSAADSLARLLRHPVASVTTWLVIGVAIALPTSLWLVLDNVAAVSARLDSPGGLSAFLAAETELDVAEELAAELRDSADVVAVRVLPREAALAEFVQRAGLEDVAASLPDNPLPHLLLLEPASDDPALAQRVAADLLARPEVDEVVLDTLWLERLQRLMALGRRAVQLLAVLLLAAVVLVLGNTIRVAIESRREEIEVIKLVGGSDAFVRRPLLYAGLWYGLGGGVVAALLLLLGVLLLAPPVALVADAYGSPFRLQGLGLVDSLQLILTGGALGLAGAWLASARHLRDIQPGAL
jgi:cell division transport system permease protein